MPSLMDNAGLVAWIQELSDLLAEQTDLELALRKTLRFILSTVKKPGGLFLIQTPLEPNPVLVITHSLTRRWTALAQDPESDLHRIGWQAVQTGKVVPPDADLDLAAGIPLSSTANIQGALLVRGPACSADEVEALFQLSRVVGRGIQVDSFRQFAGQCDQKIVQQLQVANAALEAHRWQLLKSRNTLRALFDNIPLSFYIIGRDYKLVAVNLSRARRTVEMPSALVDKQCYVALFGRNEACPGCRVLETLLSGQRTLRIERDWAAGDEPIEWEIVSYPIFDEKGQVEQAILLEQDMTDKRRLETRLIQSEKLAVVGQLAAGIAHEINNPLTAIIANTQLLRREPGLEKDVQESLELIEVAGARAAQVVRNLLDLARKDQYNFEPANVNQSIDKALALLQHEFLSRSIQLVFDKGEALPEIMISPEHMQGVWVNLLLNAIDVTSNSEPGKIQIVTSQRGNEVLVTIADNGAGIPPEKVTRIFEPFYTTKGPGHGTGLGLTICQRVIKQHGGHIFLASQLGAGTKFTVALPIS
ncbi:MAG TPA: ATP-binding protein [Anaerolineales bacterium]|nr:ATP-binding protein [Anaerolineales bacterium]